jgi:hypothetical protein
MKEYSSQLQKQIDSLYYPALRPTTWTQIINELFYTATPITVLTGQTVLSVPHSKSHSLQQSSSHLPMALQRTPPPVTRPNPQPTLLGFAVCAMSPLHLPMR